MCATKTNDSSEVTMNLQHRNTSRTFDFEKVPIEQLDEVLSEILDRIVQGDWSL